MCHLDSIVCLSVEVHNVPFEQFSNVLPQFSGVKLNIRSFFTISETAG